MVASDGSSTIDNGAGTITATGNIQGGSLSTISDYRLKDNITSLNLTNYSVDGLNPVHYKLKKTGKEQIGLIAHELQEEYPFLVEGEKNSEKFQSVNYVGLIGVLIKEIQKLKKRVDVLEKIETK